MVFTDFKKKTKHRINIILIDNYKPRYFTKISNMKIIVLHFFRKKCSCSERQRKMVILPPLSPSATISSHLQLFCNIYVDINYLQLIQTNVFSFFFFEHYKCIFLLPTIPSISYNDITRFSYQFTMHIFTKYFYIFLQIIFCY